MCGLRKSGKPQKSQVRPQDPPVLRPARPDWAPPAPQAQAQVEQGSGGQVEDPGKWRTPDRPIQYRPTRRQVAVHALRPALRQKVRPTEEAVHGGPANQAAAKAITDALAGGPLTRRKVHAFAKHPSGSRPGAPGARLPSDVVVLDPAVPRPDGPACSRAQPPGPGPHRAWVTWAWGLGSGAGWPVGPGDSRVQLHDIAG